MKWFSTYIASIILILTYSKEVFGGDFQKGIDAYRKGHNSIALREWVPLARQGHANAQYNLGVMYDKGHGVPRNKVTAIKWYKRAAEQGVTLAQYNLGVIYEKGTGVRQNYKVAVEWYTSAAQNGNANAQNNLGIMYMLSLIHI